MKQSPLVRKPDELPSIEQWLEYAALCDCHHHHILTPFRSQPSQEQQTQRKPRTQNGRTEEPAPMGNFSSQRPTLLQTRHTSRSTAAGGKLISSCRANQTLTLPQKTLSSALPKRRLLHPATSLSFQNRVISPPPPPPLPPKKTTRRTRPGMHDRASSVTEIAIKQSSTRRTDERSEKAGMPEERVGVKPMTKTAMGIEKDTTGVETETQIPMNQAHAAMWAIEQTSAGRATENGVWPRWAKHSVEVGGTGRGKSAMIENGTEAARPKKSPSGWTNRPTEKTRMP